MSKTPEFLNSLDLDYCNLLTSLQSTEMAEARWMDSEWWRWQESDMFKLKI